MNKAERLKLLINLGKKQEEKDILLFTGLPVTKSELMEDVSNMESFREEIRDKKSDRIGLTTDEM
jgi:hypothetical protein